MCMPIALDDFVFLSSILQVLLLLVLMVMDVGFSLEKLLEYYFFFVL